VVDKLVKQGSLCHYSGLTMSTTGNWRVSLERLDVRKGYTDENTVLICVEFNSNDCSARNKDFSDKSGGGWTIEKIGTVRQALKLKYKD
jgi:hypothetical protein